MTKAAVPIRFGGSSGGFDAGLLRAAGAAEGVAAGGGFAGTGATGGGTAGGGFAAPGAAGPVPDFGAGAGRSAGRGAAGDTASGGSAETGGPDGGKGSGAGTADAGVPAAGGARAAEAGSSRFRTEWATTITAEIRMETAISAAASKTALAASPRPAFPPPFFPRPDFLFFGAAETLRSFPAIMLTYHYRQMRGRPFTPGTRLEAKRPPKGGQQAAISGLNRVSHYDCPTVDKPRNNYTTPRLSCQIFFKPNVKILNLPPTDSGRTRTKVRNFDQRIRIFRACPVGRWLNSWNLCNSTFGLLYCLHTGVVPQILYPAADFVQSLHFNLTDRFGGNAHSGAYFLQGMPFAAVKLEPAYKDFLFGILKGIKYQHGIVPKGLPEKGPLGTVGIILMKINHRGGFLIDPFGLQRKGAAGHAEDIVYIFHRYAYFPGNIFGTGLTHQPLTQDMIGGLHLVKNILFPVGQTDDTVPVRQETADRLPDPPACIGTKTDIFEMIVLFRRADEPKIPFLNNIHQRNTGAAVTAGYFNHKPEICFYKFASGFIISLLDMLRKFQFFLKTEERNSPDLSKIGPQNVITGGCLIFTTHKLPPELLLLLTVCTAIFVPSQIDLSLFLIFRYSIRKYIKAIFFFFIFCMRFYTFVLYRGM
jgi:hypothetical protein